ncbi:MAG: glycosyltransferase family 4 protein [Endomicrobium sp.]|jgi:glycosyltransferase involved in cell wall biosynthesis|nr:glycosyltransferase family 4 protein [Endomicrobium sp.]
MKELVKDIEDRFSSPVYIFQCQFFDTTGHRCYNGGAERYCIDIAEILDNDGYTPVLIQVGDLDKREIWYRKVKMLNVVGVPVSFSEFHKIISLFKKYKFVIYSGLTNWGEKIHPNILISHGVTWDDPTHDVFQQAILDIIADVDYFVSVDTNTISWLRATFSKTLSAMKAAYIPNYVDTTKYLPKKREVDDKQIRVVFPRRVVHERGYWLVSKILPYILNKHKNVVFNFVGFIHEKAIEGDLKKLQMLFHSRVTHRVCDSDDMVNVYQSADISLIPTLYSEGTSLSCLEAMACGNIVIATNVGGLTNLIIDGYNGFLINPNKDELRKTLNIILDDKGLIHDMPERARQVALSFDKKIWKQKWEKIILRFKKQDKLLQELRKYEDNRLYIITKWKTLINVYTLISNLESNNTHNYIAVNSEMLDKITNLTSLFDGVFDTDAVNINDDQFLCLFNAVYISADVKKFKNFYNKRNVIIIKENVKIDKESLKNSILKIYKQTNENFPYLRQEKQVLILVRFENKGIINEYIELKIYKKLIKSLLEGGFNVLYKVYSESEKIVIDEKLSEIFKDYDKIKFLKNDEYLIELVVLGLDPRAIITSKSYGKDSGLSSIEHIPIYYFGESVLLEKLFKFIVRLTSCLILKKSTRRLLREKMFNYIHYKLSTKLMIKIVEKIKKDHS